MQMLKKGVYVIINSSVLPKTDTNLQIDIAVVFKLVELGLAWKGPK